MPNQLLNSPRRLAATFAVAALAWILIGCGEGSDDAATSKARASGDASKNADLRESVIVFKPETRKWLLLENLEASRGRPIAQLNGTNLLGGSTNPQGTLFVARDPSPAHENPVFDAAMEYTGAFAYGNVPEWNNSGTRSAFNGTDDALKITDERANTISADELRIGTFDGPEGTSVPTAPADLEFDSWITDDAMLVSGVSPEVTYGPYLATLGRGRLDLILTNGNLSPTEIFFNGRDGHFVQVDGRVGRLDVETGRISPVGKVSPTPRASDLTISVAWSPSGESFVLDAEMNVAGGTTLCSIEGGLSCEKINLPGSRREGRTNYLWTRDGKRFVANISFSGDANAQSIIYVVDAESRRPEPLAYKCGVCYVAGFMSQAMRQGTSASISGGE